MLVLVAAWSSLCAVATGALVWFIMDSRMQVRLARQREKLAEARATLETQKQALEGSLQGAQESARRQALDEFLADLRIEERHYVREHKIMFVTRKSLVRQGGTGDPDFRRGGFGCAGADALGVFARSVDGSGRTRRTSSHVAVSRPELAGCPALYFLRCFNS